MPAGWTRRVRALLAHPSAPWAIAALAVLLLLPALGNGLILDDYYHREVAVAGRGYIGEARHPLDMFDFFPDEVRREGIERGFWPWWSSPFSVGFLRPLTSLTHWLDYAAWADSTWLAHLHSLLWCGAMILAAASLYRRTLEPPWVAGLATLIFALDGGHALPASWLASRNMLVATLFSTLSIVWHVRAREQGWTHGRWLSPAALLAALLGAEIGVGALGYLLAYAAVMTPGSWRRRALTVIPHVAVVVAWQVVYAAMGYGARHAGLYTHPLHAPQQFLAAVAERAPVLLASQLTLPFADVWLFTPVAWTWAVAIGLLVVLAGMLRLLWPQLREDRTQRWYALGALLSAVPACTTFPNSRMMMFVGLGGAALMARLLSRLLGHASPRAIRALAGALLIRHTWAAAAMLPMLAGSPRTIHKLFEAAERSLPSDEALTTQTLVIVRTPHIFLSTFAPVWRRLEPSLGRSAPIRIHTASATVDEVRITRVDPHTLEIHVEGGMLSSRLHRIEWDADDPRPAGYHFELPEAEVEVIAATRDGRPETVRVRFREVLEHESLRWVAWQGRGFRTFEPPPIGATVVLEPIDMIDVVTHLDGSGARP